MKLCKIGIHKYETVDSFNVIVSHFDYRKNLTSKKKARAVIKKCSCGEEKGYVIETNNTINIFDVDLLKGMKV